MNSVPIPKHPLFCLNGRGTIINKKTTPDFSNKKHLLCRIPWLFSSFKNLGTFAFNLTNSAVLPVTNNNPFRLSTEISQKREVLSPEEQGEAVQGIFAAALASGKGATVLVFYSPKYSLCKSLLNFVIEVENRNSYCLNFVVDDTENDSGYPRCFPSSQMKRPLHNH